MLRPKIHSFLFGRFHNFLLDILRHSDNKFVTILTFIVWQPYTPIKYITKPMNLHFLFSVVILTASVSIRHLLCSRFLFHFRKNNAVEHDACDTQTYYRQLRHMSGLRTRDIRIEWYIPGIFCSVGSYREYCGTDCGHSVSRRSNNCPHHMLPHRHDLRYALVRGRTSVDKRIGIVVQTLRNASQNAKIVSEADLTMKVYAFYWVQSPNLC